MIPGELITDDGELELNAGRGNGDNASATDDGAGGEVEFLADPRTQHSD